MSARNFDSGKTASEERRRAREWARSCSQSVLDGEDGGYGEEESYAQGDVATIGMLSQGPEDCSQRLRSLDEDRGGGAMRPWGIEVII